MNENDNSKNRKYAELDKRVAHTYTKDSTATNKNALSDVYVKAFVWASRRIEDGRRYCSLCQNNSFVDDIAFDGMKNNLTLISTRSMWWT